MVKSIVEFSVFQPWLEYWTEINFFNMSGHVTFTWRDLNCGQTQFTLCVFCIRNFSCSLRFKENNTLCICSACFIQSISCYDQPILIWPITLLWNFYLLIFCWGKHSCATVLKPVCSRSCSEDHYVLYFAKKTNFLLKL